MLHKNIKLQETPDLAQYFIWFTQVMRHIVYFLFGVLFSLNTFAQAPSKMSFQAVNKNSSNQLLFMFEQFEHFKANLVFEN